MTIGKRKRSAYVTLVATLLLTGPLFAHGQVTERNTVAAKFTPPQPGTQFKMRSTDSNGTKEVTYTVVDQSEPYRGLAVFRISDGVSSTIVDRVSGNKLGTVDGEGKEIPSFGRIRVTWRGH